MGRHDEARVLEEQALEIRQRILPKDHPRIASSMTNLAVTYDALGEHEKALEMEEEVRVLRLGVCFRGRRRRSSRRCVRDETCVQQQRDRPREAAGCCVGRLPYLESQTTTAKDRRACVVSVLDICVCVRRRGDSQSQHTRHTNRPTDQ